jgi:ribosomal protein S18 acetylase RimI-like enzyme
MAQSDAEGVRARAIRPVVSALEEKDLSEAGRILRLAFGTFLGAPDPESFWSDRDYIHSRARAAHVASFGAKLDGELVGSNFATNWGSFGFFGPLTVRPDLQERGTARALLDSTMAQFDAWGTRHVGLFTFAQSAKHVALYQKYGFYARFLTAIMSTPVAPQRYAAGWSRFAALNETQREEALQSCREVSDSLCPGLDLSEEIKITQIQGLGDTVLIEGERGIAAFAICHYGPGSEAGAGHCFVKFGAVREGPSAERDYLSLLDASEALAAAVGMPRLLAGTNMARHEAYRHLVARGYRTDIQGVGMHRGNEPGCCRPGVYALDDWR